MKFDHFEETPRSQVKGPRPLGGTPSRINYETIEGSMDLGESEGVPDGISQVRKTVALRPCFFSHADLVRASWPQAPGPPTTSFCTSPRKRYVHVRRNDFSLSRGLRPFDMCRDRARRNVFGQWLVRLRTTSTAATRLWGKGSWRLGF